MANDRDTNNGREKIKSKRRQKAEALMRQRVDNLVKWQQVNARALPLRSDTEIVFEGEQEAGEPITNKRPTKVVPRGARIDITNAGNLVVKRKRGGSIAFFTDASTEPIAVVKIHEIHENYVQVLIKSAPNILTLRGELLDEQAT